MKRKMTVALTALALASSMNAKTLFVSRIDLNTGSEKIIAEKDITNEQNGVLNYNLCGDVEGITSEDYKSCESRVGYMNMNNGGVYIESRHHEVVGFKQFADRKMAIITDENNGNAFLNSPGFGEAMHPKSNNKVLRIYVK